MRTTWKECGRKMKNYGGNKSKTDEDLAKELLDWMDDMPYATFKKMPMSKDEAYTIQLALAVMVRGANRMCGGVVKSDMDILMGYRYILNHREIVGDDTFEDLCIKIKNPDVCPYKRKYYGFDDVTCDHPRCGKNNQCNGVSVFPVWCPLPKSKRGK